MPESNSLQLKTGAIYRACSCGKHEPTNPRAVESLIASRRLDRCCAPARTERTGSGMRNPMVGRKILACRFLQKQNPAEAGFILSVFARRFVYVVAIMV